MSQQKEIHMDKLQELKERVEFLEKENEYLKEASEALFMLNADDMAREHSYAREDRLRYERTMKKMLAEEKQRSAEKDKALAAKDNALAQMAQEIAELKAQLAAKK